VRLGDEVTEDTPLATLYARNEAEAEEAEKAIRKALTIAGEKPSVPPLWDAVVTAKGITYNR
jgi:thymidine phosphorylase